MTNCVCMYVCVYSCRECVQCIICRSRLYSVFEEDRKTCYGCLHIVYSAVGRVLKTKQINDSCNWITLQRCKCNYHLQTVLLCKNKDAIMKLQWHHKAYLQNKRETQKISWFFLLEILLLSLGTLQQSQYINMYIQLLTEIFCLFKKY